MEHSPIGKLNLSVSLWMSYRGEVLLDPHFLTPLLDRPIRELGPII